MKRSRLQVKAKFGRTVDRLSVLTELYAFYIDHRQCGELDGGVDGPVVWFAWDCGARIARRGEDDHAGEVARRT